MRHVIVLGLFMLGVVIGVHSADLSAQVLKTEKKDPKGDAKADPKKEAPKEIEWPKKILGKTLDQWVQDMVLPKQKDASMRDFAIKTVPLFGPDARKAASKNLIQVLTNDPDINVKLTAIQTVPLLGFDDRDLDDGLNSLYAFIRRNSGASNHTRYEVTMALGKCGPIAKKAIPLLADWTLKDGSSWQNRKAAAYALGRLGLPTPLPPDPLAKKDDPPKMSGPDVAAVRALADRLSPTNEFSHQVRREAVQSLLLLGPPQNEVAWNYLRTNLAVAFKDSDISTQIWARVCFIRTELDLIKKDNANLLAVSKLAEAHEEAAIRLEAVQALGTIGNEASSTVTFLRKLAEDPELAKIDDKEMTPAQRDKLLIAVMAIWALGQMTAEQNQLVPVLTGLQRHPKEIIKNAAKEAYTNLVRAGDPKFEPPPKKDIKKP
jgi:HEAT repeat protein